MPDAIFAHRRLAGVYDAFEGQRGDLTAYLALADELGARSVLDIGCGTGSLAVRLAASGRTVVAVDPAEASLGIAKSKEGAERITWLLGDATSLPPVGADLAMMTGNVAQVFLTDADWAATLRGIHSALRPGGHLIFETRRPERRAWEEWEDTAPVTLDIPGTGEVQQSLRVTEVRPPFVSFRYTYLFRGDGTVLTSDSTLRFRSRAEIESSLTACGFHIREVREAPDRLGYEYVFLATRSA